jgi:fermentation-respiration switch protein FrsA (DUF1100 family)
MNLIIKTVAWVLLFYCVYCLLLFLMQRSILFPRNQIPKAPERDTLVSIAGLEKILLKTEYGKIEAWFLPPIHGREPFPAPAVIFGHGNAELIDFWPEALKNFTQMGIGLLLVEYPGYGRSPGTPSERSIRHTFVAAYDALVSRKDVDPSRIILFGRSLGGGAVCALTLEKPSAALILMSAFTSVHSLAAKFGVPKFLIRDPFNNLEAVKRYREPVLVIHGLNDNIIPFSHATALHQAAQNSTLITYKAGHNDCPPDWNKFWKDIKLFLNNNGII